MPIKVVHVEQVGNVTFSQNSRSKSIRLSVRPGQKIRVSFPFHVSFREAARFTADHAEWIARQQEKIETNLPKFSDNSVIQTRFHQITFRRQAGKFAIRQVKNQIEFIYPESFDLNEPEVMLRFQKVMTGIYRWEAKKYLPPRLSEVASRYGFKYNKVSVRDNKTNWGSCSGRNNISLNLHLMKLPDHLIDFILLHELVHTRVRNHGPKFWEMLDSYTGNRAKQLTAEVKKYSVYTITR